MQSHGIGKGRKPGIRNKTKVERIIDAVVAAGGGTSEDTVALLEEHYQAEQRRAISFWMFTFRSLA